MKRFLTLWMLAVLAAVAIHAQQAKYVFYFIGDGMGLNQVNTTEMYRGEMEGYIGTKPLLFGAFPAAGMAKTYSATNPITDSAAGGTALATGSKTYNGAIGVDKDRNPLESVAYRAKKSGKKVGIATSVSIDHATPASFYAHQHNRNMYYEIACELPQSGFDFFAGAGLLKPEKTADGKKATNVCSIIEEAGYVIARGMAQYQAKAADADKILLLQAEGKAADALPYAIDRQDDDLTLAQITQSAIDFLSKDNKKGFFLMVEGGKIDWACHANDPATMVNEVVDMDNAIAIAYEFYKKHPKETLIVITADHETGGLGLGRKGYTLNLKALSHQKVSEVGLSKLITDLRKHDHPTWEQAKAVLSDAMGFWDELPVSWEQERLLHDVFHSSLVENKVKFTETLYSRTEPLATAAKQVMSQMAGLGWTTGDHSAEYVPVYAVGAGADLFMGKMDNTEIPQHIAKAARYK